MKSPGIERDREIAEIRGEVYHKVRAQHSGRNCDCGIRMQAMMSGPHLCDKKEKPYSTDISAAMELLQEMMQHWDFVEISCCQRGYVINLVMNLENFHNTHGNTLADAISGAWQNWMESK